MGHNIDLTIIQAPPAGLGPPLPVIQQHKILLGQNPPPPAVEEHSIPNITPAVLASRPQGLAQDPPRTSERSDLFTTPPNAQEMPAIEFGSERQTEKFNLLHALLAQNSFISHNPLIGEVIVEGQQMECSNFSDLLSSLYQNQTNENVRGQKEVLKELAKIFKASSIRANTLSQYVSGKKIINELIPQFGRGRKGEASNS